MLCQIRSHVAKAGHTNGLFHQKQDVMVRNTRGEQALSGEACYHMHMQKPLDV